MNPFPAAFSCTVVIDDTVYKWLGLKKFPIYAFLSLCRVPGFNEFGIKNEFVWNEELGRRGFNVPEVIDHSDTTIVKEYVPGETLDKALTPEVSYDLGKLIGELHKGNGKEEGISLGGDTKLDNFVLNDGEIYIIDPECAGYVSRRNPSLDLRTVIEQIIVRADDPAAYVDKFVGGYLENGGDRKHLERVRRWEHDVLFTLSPFAFSDSPSNILPAYRRKMKTRMP
jgi:tRNA A-37 threonylcarbamoyl transferase component Bud32